MRSILFLWCCLAAASLCAEEGDTALGYGSSLGGEVPNNAVVLPQAPAVNVPNAVRPVIVLPHTLVVPLPESSTQSQCRSKLGKPTTGPPKQGKGSPNTIKTRPIDPIVY